MNIGLWSGDSNQMKESYISIREVTQVDFFGFSAGSDIVDAGRRSDLQRIEEVTIVNPMTTVR